MTVRAETPVAAGPRARGLLGLFATPRPSRLVAAIIRRHLDVFRRTYATSLLPHFVDPLLWLAAFGVGLGGYMPRIRGVEYLDWFAPAMLVSSAMWSAAYECTYGTYIRLKFPPLFESMLAAPTTLDDVAVAEILWAGGKAAAYSAIILLVISAVGLVPSWTGVFMPVVVFVQGVVVAGLSLVFAATVKTIDAFAFYYTLVVTPMFVLSGIFFPLDQLPPALRAVAWLNPIAHAADMARALAIARGAYALDAAFWADALWLAAAAALVVPLGANLLTRRLAR